MSFVDKHFGISNLFLMMEVFFSYSAYSPKLETNSTIGNELIMRFADETVFSHNMLLLAALTACVTCWLVDNFIGKCYAVLFGLTSMVVVSLLLVLLELKHKMVNHYTHFQILVIIYIVTSPTRNILILEQDFKMSRKEILRNRIGFLVIVRLITNAASRACTLINVENRSMINLLLILVINVSYFVIFVCLVSTLNYQPTYLDIWNHCLKCIGLSMARSSMNEKSSPESQTRPLLSYNHWGFKAIKTKDELRGLPASNKRQNFMPWLLWIKNWFKPKNIEEGVHWLDLSAPEISTHVIEQTKWLINILPFVIPPFLMSNIMHFVTVMTINQSEFTLPLSIEIWPGKDIVIYVVFLDLLLFILFEGVVHPIARKFKLNDLYCILCGWVFLISALAVAYCLQISLESSSEFLPIRGKAHLRIYNSMDNDTIVSSRLFPEKYVRAKHVLFLTDIPCRTSKNFEIEVANQQLGFTKRFVLDIVEKQTISYIISYDKVERNSDTHDPTVFSKSANPQDAYLFFIHEYHPEKFTFDLVNRGSNEKRRINSKRGENNKLEPGLYDLLIFHDYVKVENMPKIRQGVVAAKVHMPLSSGSLYGLFVYKEQNDENAFKGKIVLLEGPLTLQFWVLFIQLFLTSLGHALVSVSYYNLLFLQSPDKLRVTIFTLTMIFQFLGLSLNQTVLNFDYYIKASLLILVYMIVHTIMFVIFAIHAFSIYSNNLKINIIS